MIRMFDTYIDKHAKKIVSDLLDTTFISAGKKVEDFENELANIFRIQNPVTVNSGSVALEMALELAGIRAGDEVICPAQTFIATALAVKRVGAVPVFSDIQYNTGNIDPISIRNKITAKTQAIIPVHWGGYPCDMDEITAIAHDAKLTVIEDAAHALGAVYKNKSIGEISDYTCFSFQAIKLVTTGDGGAVACLREKDAIQGRNKRWFGIDRIHAKPSVLGEREYNLKEIGFKYHLNDYAAALGIANLINVKERLQQRRDITKYYRDALSGIDGITLFDSTEDRQSACWLFGIHVEKREDFVRALKNRGVETSVVHLRIDKNECFGGICKNLYQQERFDASQIHIPLHNNLKQEDVEYVVDSIKKGW